MQASQQKPHGAFLFAGLLLLLSLVRLGAQPAAQPATLNSQPASLTNRVLELDGPASYVELPPNLLEGAREMTFEAWLKWDQLFDGFSTAFSYGEISRFFHIYSRYRSNIGCNWGGTGSSGMLSGSHAGLANIIESHQWYHLAVVGGTNGMLFYLNGSLVATNAFQEGLLPRARSSGPFWAIPWVPASQS